MYRLILFYDNSTVGLWVALSQKDVADVLIQIIQSGGSQYQSGCYGVATDILLAQLGGDIFSQVDDTCFAGSV